MMSKQRANRLAALERRIRAIPIPPAAVREAFEVFQTTGDLPTEVRLAHAVIHRAKLGPKLADALQSHHTWGPILQAQRETPPRPDDPMMNELYSEAIFGTGAIYEAARLMLRELACAGLDPTTPLFAGMKREIPDYGGVGWHLAGMPNCLVKPPYEQQAKRLLERAARLRDEIPQGDQRWTEALGEATQRFQSGGGWPSDPLVLECVLVLGETFTLMRHAAGEEVSEMLEAFARAANAGEEDREAAIAKVQELTVLDGRRSTISSCPL